MRELQLSLLGKLQVQRDGEFISGFVSAKAQALLCYLAVTARPHEREILATLLWGDLPDAEARANLRTVLANLRKLVGPYLKVERDVISFNRASPYWLDVELFETLLAASTSGSLQLAGQAIELYRGNFLEGFTVRNAPDFEAWQRQQQEHFHQMAIQALKLASAQHMEQGEFAAAIDYTRRLLALEPWQEETHRQLMLLLAKSEQRSAALAQYDLCRQTLAAELGVEPAAETQALYERLKKAGAPRPHNLPPPSTPFVGRVQELAQLSQYLEQSERRLITLAGLGGVGKTRLALQAASTNLSLFQDGVFFVALAAVNSWEMLVAHVAGAMNLSLSGAAEPFTQLLNQLQTRELLLVLDNFEQLSDQALRLVDFLRAAPRIKLLVTSREQLGLQEEWVVHVEGLPYPVDPPANVADARAYGAIAFFEQQARRVQADFTLTPANQTDIIRLCRLLNGLPLGLELAATWLPLLTCAEIITEIQHDLDFLESSLQNSPARHRSMRAVLESSWHLLPGAEREVLKRLSVFQGGFQREAAQKVAGASPSQLLSLLNKSFLRRSDTGRYDMHELIRQFAAEKLAESPLEQAATLDQHARYYAEFWQEWAKQAERDRESEALAKLSAEVENIHLGWQRAISSDQTQANIYSYWYMGGPDLSGALYQKGLAILQPPTPDWDRGVSLHQQGLLAYQRGQYATARQHLKTSLAILKAVDDLVYVTRSEVILGMMAYDLGDYTEVETLLRQSLIPLKTQGEHRYRSYALGYLGQISLRLGQPNLIEIKEMLTQSLVISREIKNRAAVAHILLNLAGLLHLTGQQLEARQLLQESAAGLRQLNDSWGLALALLRLGQVSKTLDEDQAAAQYFHEALTVAAKKQFDPLILEILVSLAELRLKTAPLLPEQRQQGGAFLTLAQCHPAAASPIREQAARLLAELAAESAPEIAVTAPEQQLKAVVTQLLSV